MTTPTHPHPTPATTTRRGRPSVAEIRARALHHDRLWVLEDVAAFLGFSVRLTEQIVRDPRVPQPRLVAKGGERRWSPTAWQQWMDTDDITFLAGGLDRAETAVGSGDDTEMATI